MTFQRIAAIRSISMLATAGLMLAGCGGRSSPTPTPTPAPVNRAPAFTSATTAMVGENSAIAFYTATATDPDGGTVTYTVGGGADAAAFAITGNELRFRTAPNFDLPADADRNNVYLVQLVASDGQATSTLDLQVTVTNSREGVTVQRIATGFVDPVTIAAIPGDTRLFVAERGGRIYTLDPATGQRTLFQTIATTTEGERGLRAIAVSPSYATNGRYFVLYSGTAGNLFLSGCTRTASIGAPGCFDFVAVEAHDATNNYGAFMGYAPDGRLYVATGDGGGSRDPGGSAQRDGSILGKLLRVDNNPDPFAGASPRYFITTTIAKGLHNPRGGGFYNAMLLLGDRGESVREEVDLVALSAGGNYGWPAKEGTVSISSPVPAGAIDPVIDYPFVAGGGVVGGPVYRGTVASLQNHYIFADQRGAIYSVPVTRLAIDRTAGLSEIELRTADFAPDVGTLGAPVVFGEGSQGELYIAGSNGEIFRVVGT